MHSWKRSWTGCWPRPGSVPGARYSMHCTGQNSGHLPHGQQRFTSMNATSRGRFFFSPISSGASGTRSSFRRRLMMSMADGRGTFSAHQRLPDRRIDAERAEEPVAHHGRRALARCGVLADLQAAARDHVVAAGRAAGEHALQEIGGVHLAVDGADRAVETAYERADRRRPFHLVQAEEEVRHLCHHVGVLHLAEHRDDDLVVERGALDRLTEDAEVLAGHARVLDLREAALVGVWVEEVARLDVGGRRLAP